ncbi:MAG: polyprenol monophosphomannose synthase [Alistipes sp.]|jgi:dolichol-phosphate mannosyltransferase|nr:polyprenol monophosphomannose synthase [Alistipes sp.]MBO5856095.1 polyprenol monophosphomannose synthase [Alistipes sp.]
MRRLIIIPTYNEKENIRKMIDRLMAMPEGFDLLIVDDGSPDGTANLVREAQECYGERLAMIERSGKLGLGTAYIAGFKYALEKGYDRIFEMDCDFSHNPDDLPRLDAMLDEKDVAIGSRYSRGVNVVNWPMGRLLMSYFASKYVRIVTRMPVADATAGFVGYRREVLEAINFDRVAMNGYGFQIEMKYTAWRIGFSIGEVSIIFIDREEGTSKMSSGIFGEAFFGVLKLPFRSIKRK